MFVKNDSGVFVNPSDNPCHLQVVWTDYHERAKELWLNRCGREIAYIDIDGVRYMPVRYRESCEVLD